MTASQRIVADWRDRLTAEARARVDRTRAWLGDRPILVRVRQRHRCSLELRVMVAAFRVDLGEPALSPPTARVPTVHTPVTLTVEGFGAAPWTALDEQFFFAVEACAVGAVLPPEMCALVQEYADLPLWAPVTDNCWPWQHVSVTKEQASALLTASMAAELVAVERGLRERLLLGRSFFLASLDNVHEVNPTMVTSLLVFEWLDTDGTPHSEAGLEIAMTGFNNVRCSHCNV